MYKIKVSKHITCNIKHANHMLTCNFNLQQRDLVSVLDLIKMKGALKKKKVSQK